MILTEIGEVGVEVDGRTHKLRPSLYAMTLLGDPAEIVRVYVSVMSDEPHDAQLMDSLAVLHACADDDLSHVFGAVIETGGRLEYEPGLAPVEHIVPLAKCLMKHGVTGALPDPPRKAGEDPEYVREFDARAHVSLAIAHLSMSSAEAWQMTMTELVGALRAKFPQSDSRSPGARAPSPEEHEATMEWFEKVEAARNKKQGGH